MRTKKALLISMYDDVVDTICSDPRFADIKSIDVAAATTRACIEVAELPKREHTYSKVLYSAINELKLQQGKLASVFGEN